MKLIIDIPEQRIEQYKNDCTLSKGMSRIVLILFYSKKLWRR